MATGTGSHYRLFFSALLKVSLHKIEKLTTCRLGLYICSGRQLFLRENLCDPQTLLVVGLGDLSERKTGCEVHVRIRRLLYNPASKTETRANTLVLQ